MCSEETKERKGVGSKSESGCCPGDFQEMISNMSGCCAGKGDLPNCEEIMSRMKAGCCGTEGEGEKK